MINNKMKTTQIINCITTIAIIILGVMQKDLSIAIVVLLFDIYMELVSVKLDRIKKDN